MKTKKLPIILLIIILVLSLGLVACKPEPKPLEPTLLTIESKTTPTIEVGQTYTLLYACNGKVTVEVSGGKYDASSQKFSAEVGTYTITVKGIEEGKSEKILTVTVTVVAGPDRTAMNTAIANANKLIASDYTTASWSALQTAKSAAIALQEGFGKTQAQIDEAKTELTAKIDALVKQALIKVETSASEFTYAGTKYLASGYHNYAAILAEIEALNARTDILVKSAYKAEMDKIVAKLAAKITLAVNGAPQGQVFVSKLREYPLVVEASETGVAYEWSIDGLKVADTAAYKFAPTTFNKNYRLEVKATKGEQIVTKLIEVSFIEAKYQVNNEFKNDITVVDDVVSINKGLGWGAQEGKKVTIPGITVSGNFSVTFDVTFNTNADPAVMALFMLNSNGESMTNWLAVCHHTNKLEVALGGNGSDKPQYDMPAGTTDLGKTATFRYTREIISGKSYYKAELIDANGNALPLTKGGTTYYSNDGFKDGNTAGERLGNAYTGPVTFGIQAENAQFTVSNLAINKDGQINTKVELNKSIADAASIIKLDYKTEFVTAFETALNNAKATANNNAAEKTEIEEKHNALKAALANMNPTNYATVTKAVVAQDTITNSVTGLVINRAEVYNFDAIKAAVTALNTNDGFAANSVYTAELKKQLELADFKIELSKAQSVLTSNTNFIAPENAEYTMSVQNGTKEVTYKWFVNGQEIANQTSNSYLFVPATSGAYTIKVVAQKGGAGYEKEKFEYTWANVTIQKTLMETRPHFVETRGASIDKQGAFTIGEGADWGDWEGRKLLLNNTLFFGSFSVSADIKLDKLAGGANVVTFHVLNADTLSPNSTRDNAVIGWGCICLHNGKLELNCGGKEQMDIPNYQDLIKEGNTITVKLTVYKRSDAAHDNLLQFAYSLWNPTTSQWITYERANAYSNKMDNGLYIGVNVEHSGITMSGIRYELLDEVAGQTYGGVVKSKLSLYNAIKASQNINYLEYENGLEFYDAYVAAKAVVGKNDIKIDFEAIAKRLDLARGALVARTTPNFTVEGLDKGYETYRGINKFEAKFATELAATNIKWSYKLNGAAAATVVDGAILPLEVGKYSEVKVLFKAGGKDYAFNYANFTVEELGLAVNNNKVVLNADKTSAEIKQGDGWGNKKQLELVGVKAKEFDLTFDVTYNGLAGGDFQVMCINLFGEDVRPVLGFQRQGQADRAQIGFDNGNSWTDIKTAEGLAQVRSTSKVRLTQTIDENGKFVQTFTIYNADGSVLAQKTSEHIHWYDSTTGIAFTFENVNISVANFVLLYR